MLKRTPLFEEHRQLGGRLVDFGGWEMPLHYGSQIEEHHRVRRDVGLFDVSHMQAVDLRGADVHAFLYRLLANNVERLQAPGKALYSCMLREDGGVLDDLIVYRLSDTHYRLVVNAATAERDLQWLARQRDTQAAQTEIQPRRDLAILAVQGPQARACLWRARPTWREETEALTLFQGRELADGFVARTGYTGEDGFEILLPAARAAALWRDLLAQEAAPCGLGARDTLRLEAGMNLYGQDMDEAVTPFEAGLAWTVDLSSGREFIGSQALRSRPRRFQLCGLVLRDKGVLRAQYKVRTADGSGEITSGTFSPTLALSIALARVPNSMQPGQSVEVEVRDKWLAAQIVKYPFVRNGKSLLS